MHTMNRLAAAIVLAFSGIAVPALAFDAAPVVAAAPAGGHPVVGAGPHGLAGGGVAEKERQRRDDHGFHPVRAIGGDGDGPGEGQRHQQAEDGL